MEKELERETILMEGWVRDTRPNSEYTRAVPEQYLGIFTQTQETEILVEWKYTTNFISAWHKEIFTKTAIIHKIGDQRKDTQNNPRNTEQKPKTAKTDTERDNTPQNTKYWRPWENKKTEKP